jgi:hypothetical protein
VKKFPFHHQNSTSIAAILVFSIRSIAVLFSQEALCIHSTNSRIVLVEAID